MGLTIVVGNNDRLRLKDGLESFLKRLEEKNEIHFDKRVKDSFLKVINQDERVSFIYDPESRYIKYNTSKVPANDYVLNITKSKEKDVKITDIYLKRFEQFINWTNLIIEKEGL
jgi:hypothetical protein